MGQVGGAEAGEGGVGWLQTGLCSTDLGFLVQMPRKEAPGFRITRAREFGLDVTPPKPASRLPLGAVLSKASITHTKFEIGLANLTRHALIVGVTGSGGTNARATIWRNLR